MAFDGGQIDAVARHIHDGYERRARRDGDWNNGMAVAEAVAQAMGAALSDLSSRLDPDETPVDLAHVERYRVGPRGMNVTLTMLVATSRRFWHVVYRDGAVIPPTHVPLDRVRTQKKAMASSIDVEQSGGGWMVTGPKVLVAWVDDIARTRPQGPIGLLAKVTASVPANPASWFPDPAGVTSCAGGTERAGPSTSPMGGQPRRIRWSDSCRPDSCRSDRGRPGS